MNSFIHIFPLGTKAFSLDGECEIITEDKIVISDDDVLMSGSYKPATLFIRKIASISTSSSAFATVLNVSAVSISVSYCFLFKIKHKPVCTITFSNSNNALHIFI